MGVIAVAEEISGVQSFRAVVHAAHVLGASSAEKEQLNAPGRRAHLLSAQLSPPSATLVSLPPWPPVPVKPVSAGPALDGAFDGFQTRCPSTGVWARNLVCILGVVEHFHVLAVSTAKLGNARTRRPRGLYICICIFRSW